MMWVPQQAGEKEFMLRWAKAFLPARHFDPAFPIGVVRDGRLAAVCVYHQFRWPSIELSFAADTPRWATRQTVSMVLGWPFWVHDVKRLTAIVERRNYRSRRLCAGLGFKREGICRDLFPDGAGVIYGMTRRWWQDSRWHAEMPHEEARVA